MRRRHRWIRALIPVLSLRWNVLFLAFLWLAHRSYAFTDHRDGLNGAADLSGDTDPQLAGQGRQAQAESSRGPGPVAQVEEVRSYYHTSILISNKCPAVRIYF